MWSAYALVYALPGCRPETAGGCRTPSLHRTINRTRTVSNDFVRWVVGIALRRPSSSNSVLYYSHNSGKQPAPYFNPAYVRSLELAATTDATSQNPPDSDVKPVGIPIKYRTPFQYEAGHRRPADVQRTILQDDCHGFFAI